MPQSTKDMMDSADNQAIDRSHSRPFSDMVRGMDRRQFLGAGAASVGLATMMGGAAAAGQDDDPSTLTYEGLSQRMDDRFHTAEGYTHNIVVRRGDPILKGAPQFDPALIDPEVAATQFGDNNDFLAFRPMHPSSDGVRRGLLIANHEFVDVRSFVPDYQAQLKNPKLWRMAQMAHGMSVVAVEEDRHSRAWHLAPLSDRVAGLNRRITAHTPMRIAGPAAGHRRMKTSYSPDGLMAFGTYGNCAGGMTPWGTVLTAEENVQFYFSGDPTRTDEAENYKRFGLTGQALFPWGMFDPRWSVDEEPNEPNHAGWMVEIDPTDPTSTPVKRTALGRFKHEGAGLVVNPDGRVVVYMGDDQQFEYLYRFVSKNRYRRGDVAHNMRLLDEGVLSVAQFSEQQVMWHPLVFGQGPHTKANGFESQADVVIEARRAADLVGATPMDRPEDVEVNPVTGSVFANLTNNTKREAGQVNAANPRGPNNSGQIVEMMPPQGDHTATVYDWTMFVMGGPLMADDPTERGAYHPATKEDGWFASPDNMTFDKKGRILIATDGSPKEGIADGVWMADVRGPGRALPKRLVALPSGAELCGPCLVPDDTALFVAVQHPGIGSSYDAPSTRWPDFDPALPPRSAVAAVRRYDRRKIGS